MLAGNTGGKSIDDAPVNRAVVPVGLTGAAAVHVDFVLPVVENQKGVREIRPGAPYKPGIVRDAVTPAKPTPVGSVDRSWEIGVHVNPLPLGVATNT